MQGGRRASQTLDHSDPEASSAVTTATFETCAEGLGLTLVQHLAHSGVGAEGLAPRVVTLASELLRRLLASFPGLYWSRACVRALLNLLELEEGEHRLGSLYPSTSSAGASSVVWRTTQVTRGEGVSFASASSVVWRTTQVTGGEGGQLC